jgi:uncharacterized protein
MNNLPNNWEKISKQNAKQYESLLKRTHKNVLLKKLPQLHDEAEAEIDCLSCAACCKSYSPRFRGPDIKRAAKYLGIKELVLIENYLQVDEDEDYVVKSKPCPFLGNDNYCSIYDARHNA